MTELKRILEDLRKYIEYRRALGLDYIISERKRADTKNISIQEDEVKTKEPPKTTIDANIQLSIFDSFSKKQTLQEIREEIGDCTRCKLHEGRTNIVFGEGNPKARLVFVGEGPGRDEDIQGRPFVGRAGQLLTKIINAMGLKRSDVYICNVVKCRPPGNRTPEQDEIGTCQQFLFKQLRSIDPKVIVCLGITAAQSVLNTRKKLGDLRGSFHNYGHARLMVTYHPAALLRNPGFKKPLWEDMQLVMKELGISKSGD
ncbi:MAG: uracil-DNA glycosylase [Deltaproteobacteria bacterium]|nr:uracil-DNA glycosylase [Deltaproteobacteria bacterium]